MPQRKKIPQCKKIPQNLLSEISKKWYFLRSGIFLRYGFFLQKWYFFTSFQIHWKSSLVTESIKLVSNKNLEKPQEKCYIRILEMN